MSIPLRAPTANSVRNCNPCAHPPQIVYGNVTKTLLCKEKHAHSVRNCVLDIESSNKSIKPILSEHRRGPRWGPQTRKTDELARRSFTFQTKGPPRMMYGIASPSVPERGQIPYAIYAGCAHMNHFRTLFVVGARMGAHILRKTAYGIGLIRVCCANSVRN